jgi:NAD(P)-dependent dehydrogenase (short-subunit alcohol dehydrogenase family)
MSFESRVIIVSGATSGIGRATVGQLLGLGARVVAIGRDRDRLSEIEASAPDGHLLAVDAELTATEAPATIVAATLERFGRIDGLVNAAGILVSGAAVDTSVEDFDAVMNINVRAPWLLTRACIPHLVAAAPSAVVNVSSVTGLRPYPNLAPYCISKAAVDHMTRCLAIELAPAGVRVNAVNPGVVVTELHRRAGMSDAAYAAFLERGAATHPIGRVGNPDEVARLIVWLLGSDSPWITGDTVPIDGGRHLTSLR